MKLLDKDLQNYKLRDLQEECLDFMFDVLNHDETKKFFLLDLPTGTGKSILALKFIQRYLKMDRNSRFDLLTESKILQNQYAEEFNSISNLWGRNTYQCTGFSCTCEEGKEFQVITKQKCDNCPYDEARESFMNGRISLTNFHMFTLMSMNNLLDRRESNILIVDEAHQLETVVSDFISVTISHNILKGVFDDPDTILNSMKDLVTIDDFIDYCKDVLLRKVQTKMGQLEVDLKKTDKKVLQRDLSINQLLGEDDNQEVQTSKTINKLKSIESKLTNLIEEYEDNGDNWVLQTEYDEKNRRKIIIQPIWAYPFFDKYIWKKYDKVILMSGTILDKNMFCYINGINENFAEYYRINSPFLVKNRPIYYMPIGKMTFKEKQVTFKKYVPVLRKILKKYNNQKGIIHTVTFEIQDWTTDALKSPRLLTHDSSQKSKKYALKQHYTSNKSTVLVSPSMSTGIDLKDSRARFQVCMKVPYPSLADFKNKKRNETNPNWYQWQTICKFIQMYGRAVRNENDKADFIVLDQSFSNILARGSHYIPAWIQDAIKTVKL